MKRLIEKIVFCGLVTAWGLATVPTRRSPEAVNATTEGVVRPPSEVSTTVGSPPSSTAMHELVVPRSIPMVFPMFLLLYGCKNLSESVADLEPGSPEHAGLRNGYGIWNALGHMRLRAQSPQAGWRA